MSESSPAVTAVVLTWNDTEMTSNCLCSVFASDYPNLKVVLVDNGSTPPVGPQLKEAFPDVDLLQVEKNTGFSGGANHGLEYALKGDPDYVHLIGNDSTLATDAISRLVEAGEANPKFGAFGPLLLNPGEKKVVQFYTATLDRDIARHEHHYTGTPFEDREWPTTESEFIPCVALMFRASVLKEVGLFDESFGTCWEDYDLCLRFQDAGWKYLLVGSAEVVHLGSQTTGRVSPYITYYTTRNRLICIRRYASKGIWFRRGLTIARSFFWQIRGYGLTSWSCHWAFLRGVFDYIFRVRGEKRA